MSKKGKWIVCEGVDGSGKSTQVAYIKRYIEQLGEHVHVSREPGGTRLGESVRAILLDKTIPIIDKRAELFLFFASRFELVYTCIQPALTEGKIVICDRFIDSTYAYQCAGHQLDPVYVDTLSQWLPKPDLTLFYDLSYAVAKQRAHARRTPDRFESETEAFCRRVYEGYQEKKTGMTVIDVTEKMSEEAVFKASIPHLTTILAKR